MIKLKSYKFNFFFILGCIILFSAPFLYFVDFKGFDGKCLAGLVTLFAYSCWLIASFKKTLSFYHGPFDNIIAKVLCVIGFCYAIILSSLWFWLMVSEMPIDRIHFLFISMLNLMVVALSWMVSIDYIGESYEKFYHIIHPKTYE